MISEYEANVRAEFNSLLENFPGVKDYHITFTKNYLSKDKFLVRLWINRNLYDSHNVTNILSNDGDFESNLKKIASKINATVVLDIYNI